jgi:hypothetical protein
VVLYDEEAGWIDVAGNGLIDSLSRRAVALDDSISTG